MTFRKWVINPEKIDQDIECTEHSLRLISEELRRRILLTINNAWSWHIWWCMSSVEMLTTLYFWWILNYDPKNPNNPYRDKVLVRGHLWPLRYNIFWMLWWVNPEEVSNGYRKFGTIYKWHEDMKYVPWVDLTPSWSLWMWLSYWIGAAIAQKKYWLTSQCYVFLWDWEEQEWNVSEAARHATNLWLSNLICIIDKNGKQLWDKTSSFDGKSNLTGIRKWYWWNVLEIQDWHDIQEVITIFNLAKKSEIPTLIIANTIKWNWVFWAEENFCWYHTISSCKNEYVTDKINEIKSFFDKEKITIWDIDSTVSWLTSKISVSDKDIFENHIESSKFEWFKEIKINTNKWINQYVDDYITELIENFETDLNSNLYIGTADWLTDVDVKKCNLNSPHINYLNPWIKEQHLFSMCHWISVTDPNSRILIIEWDSFLLRALDQINASAQVKVPFIILATTAWLSASRNGYTHQSVSVPWVIYNTPNIKMYEPSDAKDLENCLNNAMKNYDQPIYIRMHNSPYVRDDDESIDRNTHYYESYTPQNSIQINIVSSWLALEGSIEAAKDLDKKWIWVKVINVVDMKSLDKNFLKLLWSKPVLTVYNWNWKTLQSAVSSIACENNVQKKVKWYWFSIWDTWSLNDLMKNYNLDKDWIIKNLHELYPEIKI